MFKPPWPCLISSAFDDVDGWRTDPIWLNVKLILEITLRTVERIEHSASRFASPCFSGDARVDYDDLATPY
jgi:hypothetical protein